ncbi:MAG: RecB family exonuclease [Thermoplasmata archaeon]
MAIKLSYSSIETYRNCPLQYKLSRIDRIEPEGTTIETYLGTLVHEVLEKLYTDVRNGKVPKLEELIEFYTSSWKTNWNEKIKIIKKEYTPENYFEVGKRCIEGYYRRFHPFNHGITLWIEKDFTIKLEEGIEITGVIDRVDKTGEGKYEIHDYKTSGSYPTKEWSESNEQLAIYQLAVEEELEDVKEVKLIWHYLRFEMERESVRSREDLDKLKEEIRKLAFEIINATEFEPTSSALCDWCMYWKYCPLKRHSLLIEEYGPTEISEEEGYKLATRYGELTEMKKAIEAEMEEIRGKILQYALANAYQAIQGRNCEIKLREYPKLEMPEKDSDEYNHLKNIIIENGLWNEFLEIDRYKLSNAIKKMNLPKPLSDAINQMCNITKEYRVYCNTKKLEYTL